MEEEREMHSTISERSDCLREEDIVTRMSADNGHHVIFGPGSSSKHNGFFHRHKEVVEMVEPSYEVEEFMKLLSLSLKKWFLDACPPH
ncbi:hypothetical protein CEXT_162711 [Caerostris extrusa]|uniref:Uncharacterized protein n=1 Tax=Caerostris extrusa TaxID=172846 RepID=A0AAV4QPS3_CAEEX|nr:hypothetical protein CEXT_162711 [Caerostris extrusa]